MDRPVRLKIEVRSGQLCQWTRTHNDFLLRDSPQLAVTPEAGDLDFRVTTHDLLIDVPRGEAVVDLRFSEVPDLQSFDELGRQSHSFQYFVSEPNWTAFFLRSGGEPETVFPLLIVQGEEVHRSGQVAIRDVQAAYDCSTDPGCGGWGPTVATSSIFQDGKRVIFKFPISVFDAPDGSQPYVGGLGFAAHYFLELYQFGSTTGGVVQGIARIGTVDVRIDVKPNDSNNVIDTRQEDAGLLVDIPTTFATDVAPYFLFAETINAETLTVRAQPRTACKNKIAGRERGWRTGSTPDVSSFRSWVVLHRPGSAPHRRDPRFKSR